MACEICGKERLLTSHHLIPRSTEADIDGELYLDPNFLVGNGRRIAKICRECHTLIHQRFSNWELATRHNTAEKLREWYVEERVYGTKKKPKIRITHKTKYDKKIERFFQMKNEVKK